MGAHLITGYAGKAHITSGDTGMFNAAIIGGGKYVLPIGSMFEASIVTNNLVKVMDGCLINQGRNINIPVNDYEECIIDNGLQGLKRNDLIVIRYSKDVETEIEKAETIVIKGVSGDTAVDPSYLTGDILSGAATDDFPLYRVKLDGLTITALEPMFNVMVSMNSLKESLAKTNASVDQLNTNLTDRKTLAPVTDTIAETNSVTINLTEDFTNYRDIILSVNISGVYIPCMINSNLLNGYIINGIDVRFPIIINSTKSGCVRIIGSTSTKTSLTILNNVNDNMKIIVFGV